MILGLVSATVLSLAAGQALDASAGLRLESSTGKVPVVPDLPSRDVTRFEAAPSVGLTLTDREYRLTLAYSPVIYYRLPNDLERPLLLHELLITHRHTLAPSRILELRLEGSRGEVDFGRASLLAGTEFETPNVIPQSSLIKSTNGSAVAVLTEGLSRTETLRFEGAVTYARPQSVDTAFFGQFRTGLDGAFVSLLTRSDEVSVTSGFEWIEFLASDMTTAANRNLALANGQVRYRRFNGQGFQVQAGAGVSVAANTGTVVPLVDVGLATPLLSPGRLVLSTDLSAGVQGFANPTTGRYDPRSFASAALTLEIGPELTVALVGSFATPLNRDPPGATGGLGARTQTVLAGRLPVTYRVSDELSLEAGVRASTRAPRLSSPDFRFGQFELVGYATVTLELGTHNAVR